MSSESLTQKLLTRLNNGGVSEIEQPEPKYQIAKKRVDGHHVLITQVALEHPHICYISKQQYEILRKNGEPKQIKSFGYLDHYEVQPHQVIKALVNYKKT